MMSENNKQAAAAFLNLVAAGKIDEAYRTYVDMNGKHHNAFFPAGFPALQKAMKENQAQFPNKRLIVKNVLGDGDLAAAHSRLILKPGQEMSVVHLFRFADGKIVEMWDIGQAILADSPNEDGEF